MECQRIIPFVAVCFSAPFLSFTPLPVVPLLAYLDNLTDPARVCRRFSLDLALLTPGSLFSLLILIVVKSWEGW